MDEFFEEYGDMVISGIVAAALIVAAIAMSTSGNGSGILHNLIEQYVNSALTAA